MDTQLPNGLIVASGKGGVGKTWFSISLAQALAKSGKKVLLFDADLGLANVDVQLGLMPEKDLGSIISGECTLEQAITSYKSDPTTGPEIDILAGRSGSGYLANMTKPQIDTIKDGLAKVSQNYDHVIIDAGAGLDMFVQEFSTLGTKCWVVVTDDPTSLTDSYAFIKFMGQRNPALEFNIVVNMAESVPEGERTYGTLAKVCENFLGHIPTLAGVIQRDHCVRDTIRFQKPILHRYPSSKAAVEVSKIAGKIAAQSSAA